MSISKNSPANISLIVAIVAKPGIRLPFKTSKAFKNFKFWTDLASKFFLGRAKTLAAFVGWFIGAVGTVSFAVTLPYRRYTFSSVASVKINYVLYWMFCNIHTFFLKQRLQSTLPFRRYTLCSVTSVEIIKLMLFILFYL